jgi:hypothetical protein
VERLYAGEEHASPVDIVAAASVLPMLGDRRIVCVMRAERLLKPARRGGAATGDGDREADENHDVDSGGSTDTAALEAYLDRPSPSSALVFVAAAIDRTRRLTKRLLEKAQCVEFGGLPGLRSAGVAERRRPRRSRIRSRP